MSKWWIDPRGFVYNLAKDDDHMSFFEDEEEDDEDVLFRNTVEAIYKGWVAVESRYSDEISLGGTAEGIEQRKERILDIIGPSVETVHIFLHDRDLSFQVSMTEFSNFSVAKLAHRQKLVGDKSQRLPEVIIEGRMPSGRLIRFGDRRPVRVRSYRRRR